MSIIRQTRAYKAKDPPTKHQKALPPEVYRHILANYKNPREEARAYLLGGSLFPGNRSCEYSHVPRKDQKTRPLRSCDVEFRNGPQEIPQDDPKIFQAKTVVLKFGPQKSGHYQDEIPLDNNNESVLNPVILWAKIISRLRSYPNFDPRWPIYTYFDEKSRKFTKIKNSEIERDIKKAVREIGRDRLGFGPEDVGTHSNRSSLAMQLYLQGVPPYTIMLIGRWRSTAFLSYIEKQCHEFTKGMTTTMLRLNSFYQLSNKRHEETEADSPRNNNSSQVHFVHFGRANALYSRSRR